MINWLDYGKRFKYPHLAPNDVRIWERFIDDNPNWANLVAYDVRVGNGQDPGDKHEENIRKMAIKLTQYRIDVLAQKNGSHSIVEVKQDPGSGAVGQLLSYSSLLKSSHPALFPVKLVLICNRSTPDLQDVADQYSIQIIVV